MNVIVTGASGYLGNVLCRLLQEQNYHVTAVALDATTAKSLADLDIKKIDADIRDAEKIFKLFENQDVVFHLASVISIMPDTDKKMHSINVDGLSVVAEAALNAKVQRFIHLSSIHAFSAFPKEETIKEERELALSSSDLDYDRSKAQAEIVLKKFIDRGLNAIIINPTGFVGPHDYEPSLTGDAVHQFCFTKQPIAFFLPGGFNFVDVRDVAQTLINTITKGVPGENYIVGGTWIPVSKMIDYIFAARGVKRWKMEIPLSIAKIFVSIKLLYWKLTGKKVLYSHQSIRHLSHHRQIDDSKARKILDHKTRDLSESFKDVYQWLMDQP